MNPTLGVGLGPVPNPPGHAAIRNIRRLGAEGFYQRFRDAWTELDLDPLRIDEIPWNVPMSARRRIDREVDELHRRTSRRVLTRRLSATPPARWLRRRIRAYTG